MASWTGLGASCAEFPENEFGRVVSPHGNCFEASLSGRERGNVQKGLDALADFEGTGGVVGVAGLELSYCDIDVAMVVGETWLDP